MTEEKRCPRCGEKMYRVYFGDDVKRWRCCNPKCRGPIIWEEVDDGQLQADLHHGSLPLKMRG